MRRSAGLGLLMTLACPLVWLAKERRRNSLAKAASAASAANTVPRINFVWSGCGFLVMFMQAGFPDGSRPGSRVPRTRRTRSP